MRLSFHLGASKLTLLSLTLVCLVPRTVTSYPHSPTGLLPTGVAAELESALLHLQAALDDPRQNLELLQLYPRAEWLVRQDAWATWRQDLRKAVLKPWEEKAATEELEEEDQSWEEALLRAQRGDLEAPPLSPFPGGHSLESMSYQKGGEGEDGGKRKGALTSFAGGLQAVSREKGGFGFRFGRKRWTDRGW
ncbi:uncharacterized protein LOC120570933 [Perca fluviatilis]|uniref:uncharacterized protein LOC120570933 n=1 Tax=Perca fluviatilis TaxID=8168 RepID=UPI001963DEF9|nr:uncharacterized protein LOC120570933 [Perca fluviatilis]